MVVADELVGVTQNLTQNPKNSSTLKLRVFPGADHADGGRSLDFGTIFKNAVTICVCHPAASTTFVVSRVFRCTDLPRKQCLCRTTKTLLNRLPAYCSCCCSNRPIHPTNATEQGVAPSYACTTHSLLFSSRWKPYCCQFVSNSLCITRAWPTYLSRLPTTKTSTNAPVANTQSGFKDSSGRMQCDQKPMVWRDS